MSRWISRRPDYHADIDTALPRFRTGSCCLVARQYADLVTRGGGRIPSKNGLDLTGFGRAMANLALAAVKLSDACRFRIAGETIRERFALKLVGENYYDLVAPERKESAQRAIEMVVRVPCAFRVQLLQRYDNGQTFNAEACAFPLISEEAATDGFVLFVDEEFGADRRPCPVPPAIVETLVVHRDIIDLGFGVDEEFEDLVPDDRRPEPTSGKPL